MVRCFILPVPEMKKRIPELDGLRGIAILLVVSFHYLNNQLINNTHPLAKVISKMTSFGWIGVDLFFVLSGFLIGSVLLKTHQSANYFSTFYIRRLLRIVPNYYLLLVIFLLVVSLPYFQSNYFLTGNNVIPAWSYFAMVHNLFMSQMSNLGNDAISVTWSIGIEEQFYLIFPFLLFWVRKKWLPYLLALMIISAPLFRLQFDHWIPPYVLLYCRMDALAFGILAAYYFDNGFIFRMSVKYKNILLLTLGLSLVTCLYLFLKYNDLGVFRNTLFSIIFFIAIVFALSDRESIFRTFLRNRPLMWIGTISYSLYLFHYFILGIFHHVAGRRDGIGMYNLTDMLVSAGALLFSFFFAWVVYQKLEAPMVAIGKKFTY